MGGLGTMADSSVLEQRVLENLLKCLRTKQRFDDVDAAKLLTDSGIRILRQYYSPCDQLCELNLRGDHTLTHDKLDAREMISG